MILVTGATGNVGRHLVTRLSAAGVPVRALTRDPEAAVLPEAIAGDLADPDSLETALKGAESVFLVWPFLTTEQAPGVLEAIGRHARHVVYLSSLGVDDDAERQADLINQFHANMERLIETSGLEWTFLRAGTFAANALGWAEQVRAGDVVRYPFAGAKAIIHEADIAAAAARALTEDGHVGAKHILTGPEALTTAERVQVIGEAIGRTLRFEKTPAEAARARMLADGWPPALVDALLSASDDQPAVVTSTVEEITGAPARTFRNWAVEHADAFR
ncbi:NAD(P)H-binding protein [Actinoallomurus sp. CA-150999]|uniref:NmrA family NAD(P)-binding protein n=1 Tax=Actinoallomurus sp. CA-150999 TaxID=3239887 RepID=UPI003D8B3D26